MIEVLSPAEVFSASEIARAAGADPREIRAMVAAGRIPTVDGQFVAAADAVEAVRHIRFGTALPVAAGLFRPAVGTEREAGTPLIGSAVAHALMLGGFAFLMSVGASGPRPVPALETTHLVFLPLPGPGGGGGGGGFRQPAPPPRAELAGASRMRSPVPTQRVDRGPKTEPRPAPVPEPAPTPRPVEPPPPAQQPVPEPPVLAPVATVAADSRDRAGLPSDTAAATDSRGPGSGAGVGSGAGTGLGEGDGSGIGAGSGGGTGGGPYRPGSGITPPSLLKEVKPDYTEEARRRGLTGDVELEIVVLRNGSVGDIKLLRGLGSGLDQRAIEAVRQWRFAPAKRFGTPVDVLVEVAVAFSLR